MRVFVEILRKPNIFNGSIRPVLCQFTRSCKTSLTLTMPVDMTPAPIGVEIRGIDLSQDVPEDLINQFRKDVHKHRLLIFKNQGKITGNRHVEISKWFGELESTFYKHPKSPHPDVFRVSNVREEGCTNVGRTGWHIDGSFMEKPFGFSLYYMESVPKSGDTGMWVCMK